MIRRLLPFALLLCACVAAPYTPAPAQVVFITPDPLTLGEQATAVSHDIAVATATAAELATRQAEATATRVRELEVISDTVAYGAMTATAQADAAISTAGAPATQAAVLAGMAESQQRIIVAAAGAAEAQARAAQARVEATATVQRTAQAARDAHDAMVAVGMVAATVIVIVLIAVGSVVFLGVLERERERTATVAAREQIARDDARAQFLIDHEREIDGHPHRLDPVALAWRPVVIIEQQHKTANHDQEWRAAARRALDWAVYVRNFGERELVTRRKLVTHPATGKPWSDGYRQLFGSDGWLRRAGVVASTGEGGMVTFGPGWDYDNWLERWDRLYLPPAPPGPAPHVRLLAAVPQSPQSPQGDAAPADPQPETATA